MKKALRRSNRKGFYYKRGAIAAFSPASLAPAAWWRLNDGSGAVAVDSSGNGYDLALSNTPTWIDGLIGGGLNFAAASSEKAETSAAGLLATLQGLDTFTIAFWARAAAYQADTAGFAIRNGEDFGTMFLLLPYDTDGTPKTRVFYAGSSIIPAAAAAPLDEWNHFAFMSRSSTDHELFLNNVSVGTSAVAKSLPATISDVSFAGLDAGNFLSADMDELVLLDRALTVDELTALYEWR